MSQTTTVPIATVPLQNVLYVHTHPTPIPVGPKSSQVVCPSCRKTVCTTTSRKAKSSAWWSCILLFICGCSFGCCLIPCCLDSCNVVNHTCPNCNTFLGQYKP